MKKTLLAAVALTCAINANAQVGTVTSRTINTTTTTREVEVDVVSTNYNRISLSYAAYSYKLGNAEYPLDDRILRDQDGSAPGFIAEYIHGWRLAKSVPLYLESGFGLQFNMGDEKNIALFVPFNVTYRYTFNNGFYIAPLVGLDLGGKTDWLLLYTEDYDDDYKAKHFLFDYKVGANIGYKRFNFGVGYRGDIVPALTSEDDGSVKTGTFYIGLGINF